MAFTLKIGPRCRLRNIEKEKDTMQANVAGSSWSATKSRREKTMAQSPQQNKKRPRSDKGLILATERDLAALAYVAHHYIVRLDHLRELLSTAPGAPLKNPETGLLAVSTVDDIVDRWRRAGWVAYRRVLAAEPAYVWVLRRGLETVGLDELYTGKSPSLLRYHHYHCVLDVRLHWWDGRKDKSLRGQWLPERRLRAEADYVKHLPEDYATGKIRILAGAIPDAVMVGDGWTDAIEVQLTPLKPIEMQRKVAKILRAEYREIETDKEYIFNDVHFYVPSEAMQRHVEAACSHLGKDDKERIQIHVDKAYMAFVPHA
jgi:hypothetical protein